MCVRELPGGNTGAENGAGGISSTEAADLRQEARAFAESVRQWMQTHHPGLI